MHRFFPSGDGSSSRNPASSRPMTPGSITARPACMSNAAHCRLRPHARTCAPSALKTADCTGSRGKCTD
eukprot:scaffold148509_cov33-Tisochrysis_lutea.AAC.2